jgi:hypothetical protein
MKAILGGKSPHGCNFFVEILSRQVRVIDFGHGLAVRSGSKFLPRMGLAEDFAAISHAFSTTIEMADDLQE